MCLARAAARALRDLGDGVAARASDLSGHKGLLGSKIGLEMLAVLIPELERLTVLLLFLLMESVSLVNENVRERWRLGGVRAGNSRGGVISPKGMRSSTSLFERLSFCIASLSNMIAPV